MRADQMKGSSMKQCCSVKRFLAFSVVLSILGSLAVASKSFADQIVYMGGSAYESTVGGVGAPSVVKLRAKATEHADPINLSKIKATWPEYWAEYEEKGRKLEEGKKSQ